MRAVFVGLSGGVDSAVSAYLLKRQGYRVVGAFIKGWEPDFLPCTGTEDRLSAMRVAAHLGIPFVTYDLGDEYKREVVDRFVAEYRAGRTPNPDVFCNRLIKFGAFRERAKADGADFIASGHYARKEEGKGRFRLAVSKDTGKDQTYFLWTLTQDDLAHTLFPVGGMEKREVREAARRLGLPNAARKDSQGLCFLGHVDMTAFLKRSIAPKRGVVRDESGAAIGVHEGVWFYTIGQRHGFSSQANVRLYVVGKDIEKNELVVSARPLGEHSRTAFALSDANWISGTVPIGRVLARCRYRQPLAPAAVESDAIVFDNPQLAASGQSAVLYDERGRECLGGGVIIGQ